MRFHCFDGMQHVRTAYLFLEMDRFEHIPSHVVVMTFSVLALLQHVT
jgi:hypothetical protein